MKRWRNGTRKLGYLPFHSDVLNAFAIVSSCPRLSRKDGSGIGRAVPPTPDPPDADRQYG